MATKQTRPADPLTPERLDYALALANDLDARGEIVSAQLVRDLVARVRRAVATPPRELQECTSCKGYGYFDEDGEPSVDLRNRKCLDCRGTGRC